MLAKLRSWVEPLFCIVSSFSLFGRSLASATSMNAALVGLGSGLSSLPRTAWTDSAISAPCLRDSSIVPRGFGFASAPQPMIGSAMQPGFFCSMMPAEIPPQSPLILFSFGEIEVL